MKKKFVFSALGMMLSGAVFAGGLLTNTNQNIAFLRNPARDGAIGIDGVYSNPAGVAFLSQGFHVSLNFQSAYQTREVTSTFGPFAYGADNRGQSTKLFKGDAKAPVVPSLQAAYIRGRWSYSFNFAIGGGGGKCAFEDGLGSFESQAALLPLLGKDMGTRHRAGLGMSENSDAIVVIVSEETGIISMAKNGVLIRRLDRQNLFNLLQEEVVPPEETAEARVPTLKNLLRKGGAKSHAKAD